MTTRRFRLAGSPPESDLAATIDVATMTAALSRGGLPPRRALSAAAARVDDAGWLVEALDDEPNSAAALATGASPGWRVLAALWSIAESSGAPIAAALDLVADALRDIVQLRHRRAVLLAAPRATVKLVSALPLGSFAVSLLLGLNPIPVLLAPVGVALCIVGALLFGMGLAWIVRMTRSVEAEDRTFGLECVLMSVALGGGASPARARVAVVDAASSARAEWISFDRFRRGDVVDSTLDAAETHGVAASHLLLERAREDRVRSLARLDDAAERLGVRILLPLSTCLLPAFLAVGVVPVVIGLLSGLADW